MDDLKAEVAVLKNTADFQAAAIGELKEGNEHLRDNLDLFFKESWPALDKRLDKLDAKLDQAIKLELKVLELEKQITSMRGLLWKAGSVVASLSVTAPTAVAKLLALLAPIFGAH